MRATGRLAILATLAVVGTIALPLPSALAKGGVANTAGPPTTTHSVQPTYAAGNVTGCPNGTTEFINTSNLGPGNQSASYSNNGTTFTATVDNAGKFLSFTTNSPSFIVFIKGGPAYDVYDYTGIGGHTAFPSDTGLHSPISNGGQIAGIGHYLVCGQPASAVPQGSCEPSFSISAFVSGTNVTAYVPKGNWGSSATGVDVVNVEGTSVTNTLIPTGSDVINSVATNSITGQTVATANNNHVYILKGTGLDPSVPTQPLVDGASGFIAFSGGVAQTSGVAMDAVHNRALIALSVGGVGGYQLLDLTTDTFGTPFATRDPGGQISEDPLIDPIRNLLLSPAEDNNYEITNISNPTAPQFFEHPVTTGGELDSAAEDCSTGIILAPAEFSGPSQVEIADISNAGTAPEAVFTAGAPGSWTAPEQVQTLTGSILSAGASGAAVAQGTHTGIISGEFGGDRLTAIALPTTSGTGAVPAVSNWVTCNTGGGFSMGADPHTLTAYQSPNGGDAIALMVNGGATQMAVVDLTKMLNPTTVTATGNVCNSSALPPSVVSFLTLP